MADQSMHEGFRNELSRFRSSLTHEHRELLDELVRAALGHDPIPVLAEPTHWTAALAEDVARDFGQLLITMKDGNRTCGGWCSKPVSDAIGDIYCSPTCTGDVATGCACNIYSYPTPAPGKPRPRMQEWDHDWKPGDPHFTPDPARTYQCVCVK